MFEIGTLDIYQYANVFNQAKLFTFDTLIS